MPPRLLTALNEHMENVMLNCANGRITQQQRIRKACDVFNDLKALQTDWNHPNPEHTEIHLRERLKILETQLATLRFLQSERRLSQQLWIAIPSLFTGSLLTLLIQKFM